jgi:hypothetical protein
MDEAATPSSSISGAHSATPPPIDAPIFLVGCTRSGTTVLSLMLGHHPDIAFVSELEWVWDCASARRHDELDLSAYHAWLTTHRAYLFHSLSLDRALSFRALTRDLFEQLRKTHDPSLAKSHVGCQVHRHYEEALRTWPRARFIHIVRDGRDVCASWIKFGWLGNGYEAGVRWKGALLEWERVKELIPEAQRTEVRFETLIQEPEAEIRRLCAFTGVPYDNRTLRYHEDTSYEPIDPKQAGKWRKQLTQREVQLFEAVAGEALLANGYALSGQPALPIRPWDRALIELDDKFKHHRARAKRYGSPLWLADIATRVLKLNALQDRVRLHMNEIENARLR